MKNLKRIIGIMITVVLLVSMCSIVFATPTAPNFDKIKNGVGDKAKTVINTVLRIVAYAAWGVALGMLVYIGIKYMTAGAGEKAKVKETLLPYLIGALIVASASSIAGVLIPSGSAAISNEIEVQTE